MVMRISPAKVLKTLCKMNVITAYGIPIRTKAFLTIASPPSELY